MTIDTTEIVKLRKAVAALQVEFDLAIAFHEAWRPMAYDHDLHRRMGKSKASQTFLVIRVALRREMLLALLRMWDTDRRAVSMVKIAGSLGKRPLIEALAPTGRRQPADRGHLRSCRTGSRACPGSRRRSGGLLSNDEWAFFEPFVVDRGAFRGCPSVDHRRTLDAVFWIARTGAPWRDLPEELGNWNSVHKQYRRWTASGLWDLMLEALAEGGGNDAVQMVDNTVIRAHHCAAGAKGGLKTKLLAARAVASRPKFVPRPTLRVFQSRSC